MPDRQSQAQNAPVQQHNWSTEEERYALEIRTEVLRTLAMGRAMRQGESDRLEIGGGGGSDEVIGAEALEVGGKLTERVEWSATTMAGRIKTKVQGHLEVEGANDTTILAGAMLDTQAGGVFLAAGMSDDLVLGGGVRITAMADLWMNGLTGLEEKAGTAAADGAFVEAYMVAFEREYSTGVHNAGAAMFSGTVHTTMASGFRPMVEAMMGVRNLTPGGGGGGGGGAPVPAPPPAPAGGEAAGGMLAGAAGAGRAGTQTGSAEDMAGLARMSEQASEVGQQLDDVASTARSSDTAKILDQVKIIDEVGDVGDTAGGIGDTAGDVVRLDADAPGGAVDWKPNDPDYVRQFTDKPEGLDSPPAKFLDASEVEEILNTRYADAPEGFKEFDFDTAYSDFGSTGYSDRLKAKWKASRSNRAANMEISDLAKRLFLDANPNFMESAGLTAEQVKTMDVLSLRNKFIELIEIADIGADAGKHTQEYMELKAVLDGFDLFTFRTLDSAAKQAEELRGFADVRLAEDIDKAKLIEVLEAKKEEAILRLQEYSTAEDVDHFTETFSDTVTAYNKAVAAYDGALKQAEEGYNPYYALLEELEDIKITGQATPEYLDIVEQPFDEIQKILSDFGWEPTPDPPKLPAGIDEIENIKENAWESLQDLSSQQAAEDSDSGKLTSTTDIYEPAAPSSANNPPLNKIDDADSIEDISETISLSDSHYEFSDSFEIASSDMVFGGTLDDPGALEQHLGIKFEQIDIDFDDFFRATDVDPSSTQLEDAGSASPLAVDATVDVDPFRYESADQSRYEVQMRTQWSPPETGVGNPVPLLEEDGAEWSLDAGSFASQEDPYTQTAHGSGNSNTIPVDEDGYATTVHGSAKPDAISPDDPGYSKIGLTDDPEYTKPGISEEPEYGTLGAPDSQEHEYGTLEPPDSQEHEYGTLEPPDSQEHEYGTLEPPDSQEHEYGTLEPPDSQEHEYGTLEPPDSQEHEYGTLEPPDPQDHEYETFDPYDPQDPGYSLVGPHDPQDPGYSLVGPHDPQDPGYSLVGPHESQDPVYSLVGPADDDIYTEISDGVSWRVDYLREKEKSSRAQKIEGWLSSTYGTGDWTLQNIDQSDTASVLDGIPDSIPPNRLQGDPLPLPPGASSPGSGSVSAPGSTYNGNFIELDGSLLDDGYPEAGRFYGETADTGQGAVRVDDYATLPESSEGLRLDLELEIQGSLSVTENSGEGHYSFSDDFDNVINQPGVMQPEPTEDILFRPSSNAHVVTQGPNGEQLLVPPSLDVPNGLLQGNGVSRENAVVLDAIETTSGSARISSTEAGAPGKTAGSLSEAVREWLSKTFLPNDPAKYTFSITRRRRYKRLGMIIDPPLPVDLSYIFEEMPRDVFVEEYSPQLLLNLLNDPDFDGLYG